MTYLDHVNIRQGSDSCKRYSRGNTLPLTQLPFAMASFAPQTNSTTAPWYYNPHHRSLEGIRLTHQPGPWIADYGAIVLQPQRGEPRLAPEQRWSGFKPEEAILRPDYLRGGVIRVRYDAHSAPGYLSVMPIGGENSFTYDARRYLLTDYTTMHSYDDAKDFHAYFALQFSPDNIDAGGCLVTAESGESRGGAQVEGRNVGIHLRVQGSEVNAHLAISYISAEQAMLNLAQQRTPGIEEAREHARQTWEEHLSKIEVETETPAQMATFYSCMYRVFLYPHMCYELDGNGKPIHYCPADGRVREGIRYTDIGFWDAYRTTFPLLSIIAPDMYAQLLAGFVQDYLDCGWLPRWPSIGEVGGMPSTPMDAVIADAAAKGIVSEELLRKALEGMLRHANEKSPDRRYGRKGVEAYLKYGYIPYTLEGQSVNLSLDAAYFDYCISVVAGALGDTAMQAEYQKRALNYTKLFDAETGFMRGRDEQGNMADGFDPYAWGGEYTEGSAWQTSFSVPHDIEGLARLYGGPDALARKLDTLFAAPTLYTVGGYGHEIHEMTEMASVNFGQCAISNQPSFSLPYLYAALDQPEKTGYWVEKICRELFSAEIDGFPGDEDNGSTSAWYVLSCLGLYPLCPGKPEYIKGKQLVKRASIWGKPWDAARFDKWIPHSSLR